MGRIINYLTLNSTHLAAKLQDWWSTRATKVNIFIQKRV